MKTARQDILIHMNKSWANIVRNVMGNVWLVASQNRSVLNAQNYPYYEVNATKFVLTVTIANSNIPNISTTKKYFTAKNVQKNALHAKTSKTA